MKIFWGFAFLPRILRGTLNLRENVISNHFVPVQNGLSASDESTIERKVRKVQKCSILMKSVGSQSQIEFENGQATLKVSNNVQWIKFLYEESSWENKSLKPRPLSLQCSWFLEAPKSSTETFLLLALMPVLKLSFEAFHFDRSTIQTLYQMVLYFRSTAFEL